MLPLHHEALGHTTPASILQYTSPMHHNRSTLAQLCKPSSRPPPFGATELVEFHQRSGCITEWGRIMHTLLPTVL